MVKKILITVFLVLIAWVYFFPITYMLSLSVKTPLEVFKYPPEIFSKNFYFKNYVEALEAAPLLRFLLNSVVTSFSITVFQVLTSCLTAYALSRMEFFARNILYTLIIATMLVPAEVTIIPNYLTFAKLGLLDTYTALVSPYTVTGFGIFLLYQFFKSVPKELEEAAWMDGCSRLRFLFQILIPLSWPAILSLFVYAFVSSWNQYLWPLIVTQSTSMQTAQIGLGMFRSAQESNSWGVIMAASTLLIFPSIFLFLITQRHFVRGIMMGGLKG